MLTQLYIDNVAVIEHTEVCLGEGLTVLTGETGAGKSILIDALAAVLGERTGRELVRTGCPYATVTAVFDRLPSSVIEQLEQQGFSPEEDGTLLLRRRISAENKNACFIGGSPCTASVMRSVGRLLVNIHGQHENQALLSVERHVEYLDRLGGLEAVRDAYHTCYKEYCTLHRQLRRLSVNEDAKAQRMDMLRFQIDELEAANLTVGEEERLTERRDLLRNAEKINRLLSLVGQTLDGDEQQNGAVSAVEQSAATLREAGRFYPEAHDLSVRLHTILPELQDIAATVSELSDDPQFDPALLDQIEDRLALVRRLGEKYGGTAQTAISYLEQAREELRTIEVSDEEIARLSAQLSALQEQLVDRASCLTKARRKAAQVFSEQVCRQLRFLDMPRVTLAVSIEKAPMTANGADKVEFLISANPGEPPKPIAKIASGGELSRIMLALKSVMSSADDIPTLIFDEIDVGISGHAAAKVGSRLRRIAGENKQVLCVTHLAQIAACAHEHFLIKKSVINDRTVTDVQALDEQGRCEELARIIGGHVTPSSLQTASEMLVTMPQYADETEE